MSDAILLLDNKDSFVWNLAQALQMLGREVVVVRSDRTTVGEIAALRPTALVLSPGPGRPEDAGVCVDAVRALHGEMPILGVCLGHQVIGTAFGASIVREAPCHGKAWPVHHAAAGLMRGLESPFLACRYHSLVIDPDDMPDDLVRDAWTAEGVIMAVHHREHATFGVQFHPESFRTQLGLEVLGHFLEAGR